jgi:hypothetical protein
MSDLHPEWFPASASVILTGMLSYNIATTAEPAIPGTLGFLGHSLAPTMY